MTARKRDRGDRRHALRVTLPLLSLLAALAVGAVAQAAVAGADPEPAGVRRWTVIAEAWPVAPQRPRFVKRRFLSAAAPARASRRFSWSCAKTFCRP